MNAAADSSEKKNSQLAIGNRQSAMLRPLYAEWHKLSPGIAGPEGLDERELRIYWTNSRLGQKHGRSVLSWKDLTPGQARFLLKRMREESGDAARYRAMKIAQMACELWGGQEWDDCLRGRLGQRYHLRDPRDLLPDQAHELIEELLSRIARRDGVEIEDVRKRFTAKKAVSRKPKAESSLVAQGPQSGLPPEAMRQAGPAAVGRK